VVSSAFLKEVAISGLLYPQTREGAKRYLKEVHQADFIPLINTKLPPLVFPLDYADKLRKGL
jgi:hypothetical protein